MKNFLLLCSKSSMRPASLFYEWKLRHRVASLVSAKDRPQEPPALLLHDIVQRGQATFSRSHSVSPDFHYLRPSGPGKRNLLGFGVQASDIGL